MIKKYVLFFTLLASFSGVSADRKPSINSDHNLFTLSHPLLGDVNQFNLAVPGTIHFGPGDKPHHKPYIIYTTLRDPRLLFAIHETGGDVYEKILKPIAAIATDANKEVSVKNKELAEIYKTLETSFNQYFFSKVKDNEDGKIGIKEINIWPKRLFNNGANNAELEKSPENYVHSFSISLEDLASYTSRQERNFKNMFENKPAIVFAQEVELGLKESKSLTRSFPQVDDFNKTFEMLMEPYEANYKAISPKVSGKSESVAVIFYDKKLTDVSDKFDISVKEIRAKIKAIFGYEEPKNKYFSENKCLVAALEFEGKTYFAINVHAEYGYVNENAEKIITGLQNLFDEKKDLNFIFGSDLNLEKQKKEIFEKSFAHRFELVITNLTPEPAPENGGNPTMDLIIATPVK